jgi:hypothetical protein
MSSEMSQLKRTANSHMRRDLASGKWTCACEACREMRSLTGMDKMLGIWPLVREIQDLEADLDRMPEGTQRETALERYLSLYDQLANEMSRPT